jgi:oligoendopeptidase F
VYQYATSYAASAAIMNEISSGDENVRQAALERYLNLLKSGGNDHPMAQLKRAGVDLSKPATTQAIIAKMDNLVSRLEVELAKL